MAVAIGKRLHIIQLICISAIGIILATYTSDNLCEELLGRTYGI